MPAPLAGRVVSGKGFVQVVFSPPLEFVGRQHGEFARRLQDLSGLWARFAPIMSAIERQWFDTAGFGTWPPLAESTVAEKERLGFPSDPLVRTGNLRDSLVDPSRAMRVGRNVMVWGTDVDYAEHHQDPAVAGRPPERQVIPDPMPPDLRRRFESATVAWINDAAAAAYGRRAA
jgi:phage gpG-like protein